MAQSFSTSRAPLSELPLTQDELERTAMVDFAVDRDSELPVGTQLSWKLRAMIVRGALRSGDRLPSVRELAGFAGVNVNTARAAYVALEREELIASEHGRGTYVTERAAELRGIDEVAEQAIERARDAGVDVSRARRDDLGGGRCRRVAAGFPMPPFPRSTPAPAQRPCAASCARRSPGSRPSSPPTPGTTGAGRLPSGSPLLFRSGGWRASRSFSAPATS